MDLNRRETQRQLIMRAARFTRHDDFNALNIAQIKTRLATLADTYDRFMQEHQSVVENVADNNGMAEQNTFAANVQETYIATAAKFEQKMQELRDIQNPPPINHAAQIQAMHTTRDMQQQMLERANEFVQGDQFNEQTIAQLKTRLTLLSTVYEDLLREHRKISEDETKMKYALIWTMRLQGRRCIWSCHRQLKIGLAH